MKNLHDNTDVDKNDTTFDLKLSESLLRFLKEDD